MVCIHICVCLSRNECVFDLFKFIFNKSTFLVRLSFFGQFIFYLILANLSAFETLLSLISNSCGRFRSKTTWYIRTLDIERTLSCVIIIAWNSFAYIYPTKQRKANINNDEDGDDYGADWLICFEMKPSRSHRFFFRFDHFIVRFSFFFENQNEKRKN